VKGKRDRVTKKIRPILFAPRGKGKKKDREWNYLTSVGGPLWIKGGGKKNGKEAGHIFARVYT